MSFITRAVSLPSRTGVRSMTTGTSPTTIWVSNLRKRRPNAIAELLKPYGTVVSYFFKPKKAAHNGKTSVPPSLVVSMKTRDEAQAAITAAEVAEIGEDNPLVVRQYKEPAKIWKVDKNLNPNQTLFIKFLPSATPEDPNGDGLSEALKKMCESYGEVEELRWQVNSKSGLRLTTASVRFGTVDAATKCWNEWAMYPPTFYGRALGVNYSSQKQTA
ncbi:hypothetical protein CYLTODRAFT_419072 [Cylindrobasidium torrendii FP15055 ss-10]|uniref:RRM domain-containing protein n=1 Tax=Cylindrobasidium torrendii FP15055 ss-10 TaxID=1314674 RepID=A0A0D7BM55_9AGAR|nr:hypothetical protein CYLTODRAFT_419072 [Cylindrobasidium torrendii FP15055 ss-10]